MPDDVLELAARVQAAAAYIARIATALRGKQGMEEVEAVIAEVGGYCAECGTAWSDYIDVFCPLCLPASTPFHSVPTD
jgi:rubrerythrin